VREQIEELTNAWRARQISGERYFALLAGLEADERSLNEERTRWLSTVASSIGRSLTIRDDWDKYVLAEKRAYIQDALVAVMVLPLGRLRRWDPDRLRPVWRED